MHLIDDRSTSPAVYVFRYAYAAEGGLPSLTEKTVRFRAPLDGQALRKAFEILDDARVPLPSGDILASPLSLYHQASGRRIPLTAEELRNLVPHGSAD